MTRERLNLDYLVTFLALLESGSFGEAGARLGLAQSTISQQLKRLEEALGTLLIVRGKRGCLPTPAALRILPYAKSMLRIEEHVVYASVRHAACLAACNNIGIYLLPNLLRAFREQGGTPPTLSSDPTPKS